MIKLSSHYQESSEVNQMEHDDQVHALEPYASHGVRDTRNNMDNIHQEGGSQLLLTLTPTESGYTTIFDIGLDI